MQEERRIPLPLSLVRTGFRKIIPLLVLVKLLSVSWLVTAQEIPTVEEIRDDVRKFQNFFLFRFPGVSLNSFRDGVSALPQYSKQLAQRELLLMAPPQVDEVEAGRIAWDRPMISGSSLRDCFKGKPPAFSYPYFLEGEVRTIERDINLCRTINNEPPLDAAGGEMARLVAAFKEPWQELPLDVEFREEEMRRLYAIGRQYFWSKRGQMNLSCANCHVHNSGNRLRGEVLSAALGHGMGYPAYSIRWSLDGDPMVTLHNQYALCNARVGAAPLEAQSDTYIGLELYQAIMNSGITVSAPGLRP